MIALSEPGEEEIAEAIKKAGGEPYITKVADRGLRIESYEF